ncbi:MAG: hypothetical protein H6713_17170 [Myxococcales bacterium]|nr:hypothetical protein [Myxococcales bacterium]
MSSRANEPKQQPERSEQPSTASRKKPRGPLRYRKTEHRFLEDLVLVLRVAGELELDLAQAPGGKARQVYSAAELRAWQRARLNHEDQPKRFDHLEPARLREVFPETDGEFSDALLERIMAYQAPDHQRIFRVQRDDGVWRYGAHQGLHEHMRYTELAECPPELTVAMHLTKPPTAKALLAGVAIENNKTRRRQRDDPDFVTPAGTIVGLGRYIHAFAWFALDERGSLHAIDERWPMRARLFRRFRDRVGLGVDMPRLRAHYEDQGVAWPAVCGLNAIGTVVFFRPIPPEALIARGRAPGSRVGGEAYPMTELWRMTHADLETTP